MFRHSLFAAGAIVAAAAPAHAADKPLFQPVPAWVKQAGVPDAAALAEGAPIVVILDSQQRLEGDTVWTYSDRALRVQSTQALTQIGTLALPWQPARGDLIIHRIEIIRGTEHIDLLAGGRDPFSVLRREEGLEKLQFNGVLTATMAVEGLRVGDVLRTTFSVTQRDAVLGGAAQLSSGLPVDPFRVTSGRARLLWPAATPVKWRLYAEGADVKEATVGGYHEVSIALPLPKQPETPADAPLRFRNLPLVEATTFPDWAAVSKTMAPLYRTEGTIPAGSALAAEVSRIEKLSADPRERAAAALALVQDKVRYLFNGMADGNYVPQTPGQTWSLRYGDCKAKTLLLLAILHALGIEAEPVLANLTLGDYVAKRLPAPAAFDHILVRATIAGKSLWLDGTGNGSLLADLDDTPPLGNVLPVRTGGAQLLPVDTHAPARPDLSATIDLDERAGIYFPATFKATFTVRGTAAQQVKLGAAQGSRDDIDKFVDALSRPFLGETAVATRAFSYDDAAGTATLSLTGATYPDWSKEAGRYVSVIDTTIPGIGFAPERARAAWQNIPVSTGAPGKVALRVRIQLPDGGAGFGVDGARTFAGSLGGEEVARTVTVANGVVEIADVVSSSGREIAPADIPAARQRVAQSKEHPLRATAPASYPPRWALIAASRKDKRFDPALAVYGARIAERLDDRSRYTDRAWLYERINDSGRAIADLTKAIAIEPTVDAYVRRAAQYRRLGDKDHALADAQAAYKLDPTSDSALDALVSRLNDHDDTAKALAILDERIADGGKGVTDLMAAKAEVQQHAGDRDGAIATIDAAIAKKPGSPALLNSRCWLKGTMNVALDTALKDCTKAIELSDSPVAALDSRAIVYFRMNRLDDAMTDLDAVLEQSSELSASLFMRGVIRKRRGDLSGSAADLAAARAIDPRVDETYARFGITP